LTWAFIPFYWYLFCINELSVFKRVAIPTGDNDLEIRKDDLKKEIDGLTKTHEKQVLIYFLIFSILIFQIQI
jgi:hypothetical protein